MRRRKQRDAAGRVSTGRKEFLGPIRPSYPSRWCEIRGERYSGHCVSQSTKVKSPEVMLISFVSASSSRLDPHSTCSRRFLAGCNARSSFGLRAHRQPDKPVQRLGTLSCLHAFVLVLLDQRFAIDPCEPSLVSFESSVIPLEPRTSHQSAKLKNVPKNEYGFTLF